MAESLQSANRKSEGAFRVESQRRGDHALVRLSGELDLSGVERLEGELERLSDESHLVLDLTRLSFIDSSGLRALLAAWGRSQQDGHSLTIVRGPDDVHRIFELTGMDAVLPIRERIPDR
jgi:anti-anti-sigma factor